LTIGCYGLGEAVATVGMEIGRTCQDAMSFYRVREVGRQPDEGREAASGGGK
jgi:hypothetical protein